MAKRRGALPNLRRRALVRGVLVALALVVVIAIGHVLEVALTPVAHDGARESCVIVLGAAVWDDAPSPVYEARLRFAVELARGGTLVVTGGVGDDDTRSEANVGKEWALAHGHASERILVEDRSRTTAENLAFALPLLEARGLSGCALVSDPLHLPRALVIAEDLGLVVKPAATPYSRYQSVRPRAAMLGAEAYYLAKHRALR